MLSLKKMGQYIFYEESLKDNDTPRNLIAFSLSKELKTNFKGTDFIYSDILQSCTNDIIFK